MKLLRLALVFVAALAVGVGCSDEAPRQTEAQPGPKRPVKPQAEAETVKGEEKYRYDPVDKRDPFRSYIRQIVSVNDEELVSPLQHFDISQLLVTGIIWSNEIPRALIEDPAGKGYIVETGAAIGRNRGRIVGIEDNRVIVKETYVNFEDRATTKEVEMYLYERNGG